MIFKVGDKVKLTHDYFGYRENEDIFIVEDASRQSSLKIVPIKPWQYRGDIYTKVYVTNSELLPAISSNLDTQWVSVKLKHRMEELEVEFLINSEGSVLARLRKCMRFSYKSNEHTYRIYTPPVSFIEASLHTINYSERDTIVGDWQSDKLRKAVENKVFGKGEKVVTARKTSKTKKLPVGIKKVVGPYGTDRYIDILTKKYVKTPA